MQSGGMDSITNGTLRAAEAVRQFLASTAPMGSNNTDGVPDYPLLTAYSRVMRRYYYNVSDPHARVYEAPELFRLMLHDPELCAHAPMPWLASITLSASLRWWSMVKKVLSPDLAQRRGPSIGTSSLTAPASVMEGAERCRHVADDIEVALQLLVSLSSPYRHQRHPPAAVGCTARSLLCQRPCVAYLTLLLNVNNNNRNDIGYPVLQLIAHSWGSSPSMADILHQCWDRYREAKQQLLLLSHTPSEGVEEGETQKDGAGDAPPSPAPMRWEGLPGLPTHPSDVLPPSSLSSTSGGLDVVEIAWACMVSMATAAQDCFELLWWARSRLLALSSLDLRIKEVLDDVDAHTFFAEVWACEELCQEILADVEVPRALVSPPSTHANSRGVDGEAAWAKLHSMYTSLIGTVADLSSFWFRMYAFHGELQAPAENGIWMTIHRVAPSNPRFHSSHNDPTYADAWQIRLMVDQHLTQVLESGKRFGAQVYLAHLTSLLKNYPDYYPDLLVLTLGRQFVSDHTKAVLPLGLVDALTTCLRYHLPVMPLPPPSLLLSSAAFTSSSAAPSSSATPTPPPTTTTEESTAAGDASASPAEPCPSDARSTDGTQPSSRFYNAAEYRCKEDETMDTLCALYAGTSPLPIASYKAIHACLSVLKVCVESAGHTSTNPLSLLLAEAQELRRGFSSSARYEHFKTHGRSPDACGPQRSNLITLLHALMRQPRYGGLSSMAMMLFSACIHHSVQDMVPLLRDHGLLTSILSHIHRPACSRMLQDAGMKMKLASLCIHDDAMTVEHRYLMDEIPILALPTLIQAFSVHQSTHELFTRHRRWFERVFDAFLSAPFDAEELVSEGYPWKVGEWREAEGSRNANTTIRNVPIPSSTSSSSVVADTPVDPRTNLLLCVRSKYRLARSSESEHRLTSLQNIFAMMMDLPEICSIATTMVEVHVPRMELPTDESFINRCSAMDGMVLSLLQAMQIVVVGSDVAGKRRGRDVEKLREFLQSLGDLIGEWLDALLKLCSTNSGTSFRVEAVAELLRSSIFGCAVMALRRTGEMNDPITAVLHKFVAGALGRLKGATSRNRQQRGRRGRQQLSEADAAILLQILHAVGFSQQRRKDASHELGTWLANVYLCIVPWTRPSGVVSGGDAGGDASRYTQDGPSMEVEAGGEEDATSGLYSMLVYGNTGQSGQATSQSMYLPGFSDDLPMQLFSRRVASREAAAMAASALIAPSYLSPAVATASAGDGGGATAAAAEPQIGWGSILESSINVRQYLNTPYQVPPLPPIEMDDDDEGGEDDDDAVDEPAAVFVDDDPDRLLRCQGSYADAFCRQMGRGLTILARGQEASSTYSARLAPRDRNLHVVPNKELLSPGATLKLDQELLRLISAAATAHLLVQPPHDGVADGAGEVMMPVPHEAVQSFRAMVLRGLNLRMLREHALRATIVEASFRGGNHSQAYQAVSEVMAVFLSRVIMMMLIICDDGEHHPLTDADLQAKLDAVKQEFLLLMWPISRFALHRRYCLLDAHSGMEVVGLSTCLIYLFFVLWPTLKLPDMPAHLAITAVELLHEVIAHPNGRRARIDLNPEKEDPKNAYIKQIIMPVGLLLPLKVHAAMWAVVWSLHDDALHHRMMPFTNETRGVASSIQTYTTTNTTPEEMVKSDEEVAAALAPRPLTWKMKDFAVDAAKWVADIIARCNANNCRSNTAARETSESAALQMRQQCVLTLWRISTISCTGTPDASYPAPDRPGAAFTAVLAGEEVGDEMLSRIVFVVDNEVSGVPLLLKRVLMDPRRNACLLEYCAVLLSQLNVTPALEILARTPLPKLIFTAITRVVKELQDSLHGLPRGQDEEAEKVRRADVRYECRCLLAQLLNFLALCRNLRPLNTNGQFHACPDISRASICRHGHQCPHVHAMEPPTEVDAECAYIILQTDYFLQNQGIAGGDCIHYAREAYAHRKTYGRSRVPCSLLDEALCVEVWEYLQQYLESVFTNDERMGDSWEEVHGAATSSSSSPSSSSPSRTMERMMHACDTDTSVSVSGVPLTMLVAQVASQILDTHAASPAFVAPLHSLRGSSLRITHWCIYLLCSAGRGYETLLPALRQLITDQERMLIPTYDAIQSTVELLVALQRGGCQRLPRAEVRQLMEEMRSGGTTTHTGEMNTCTNNTHAEVGVEDEVPRASHHLIPLSSLLKALPRQFLQNPTGLTDTIMKYCRLRWMQSRMPQDAVGVWVAPPPPPVSIRSTTAEDAERFCVILIRTLILTHHRGQLTDIDVSNILGVVLTAPGLEKLLLEPTFSTAVGCYAALPWFSYFGLHNNSNDTAQRANSAHSTMDHGSNNNNINVRTILDLGITQDALPRQFYSLLSGRASCAEELHAALRHCVAATCSNPGGREVVRGGGRAAHMDPDVDGGMGGGELHEPQHHRPRSHAYRQQQPHALATRCHTNQANNAQTSSKEALYVDISNGDAVWALLHIMCGVLDSADGPQVERDLCRLGTLPLLYEIIRLHRCRTIQQASLLLLLVRRVRLSTRQLHFATRQLQQNNKNNSNAVAVGPTDAMGGGGDWSLHAEEEEVSEDWQRVVQPLIRRDNTNNGRTTTFTRGNNNNDARNSSSNTSSSASTEYYIAEEVVADGAQDVVMRAFLDQMSEYEDRGDFDDDDDDDDDEFGERLGNAMEEYEEDVIDAVFPIDDDDDEEDDEDDDDDDDDDDDAEEEEDDNDDEEYEDEDEDFNGFGEVVQAMTAYNHGTVFNASSAAQRLPMPNLVHDSMPATDILRRLDLMMQQSSSSRGGTLHHGTGLAPSLNPRVGSLMDENNEARTSVYEACVRHVGAPQEHNTFTQPHNNNAVEGEGEQQQQQQPPTYTAGQVGAPPQQPRARHLVEQELRELFERGDGRHVRRSTTTPPSDDSPPRPPRFFRPSDENRAAAEEAVGPALVELIEDRIEAGSMMDQVFAGMMGAMQISLEWMVPTGQLTRIAPQLWRCFTTQGQRDAVLLAENRVRGLEDRIFEHHLSVIMNFGAPPASRHESLICCDLSRLASYPSFRREAQLARRRRRRRAGPAATGTIETLDIQAEHARQNQRIYEDHLTQRCISQFLSSSEISMEVHLPRRSSPPPPAPFGSRAPNAATTTTSSTAAAHAAAPTTSTDAAASTHFADIPADVLSTCLAFLRFENPRSVASMNDGGLPSLAGHLAHLLLDLCGPVASAAHQERSISIIGQLALLMEAGHATEAQHGTSGNTDEQQQQQQQQEMVSGRRWTAETRTQANAARNLAISAMRTIELLVGESRTASLAMLCAPDRGSDGVPAAAGAPRASRVKAEDAPLDAQEARWAERSIVATLIRALRPYMHLPIMQDLFAKLLQHLHQVAQRIGGEEKIPCEGRQQHAGANEALRQIQHPRHASPLCPAPLPASEGHSCNLCLCALRGMWPYRCIEGCCTFALCPACAKHGLPVELEQRRLRRSAVAMVRDSSIVVDVIACLEHPQCSEVLASTLIQYVSLGLMAISASSAHCGSPKVAAPSSPPNTQHALQQQQQQQQQSQAHVPMCEVEEALLRFARLLITEIRQGRVRYCEQLRGLMEEHLASATSSPIHSPLLHSSERQPSWTDASAIAPPLENISLSVDEGMALLHVLDLRRTESYVRLLFELYARSNRPQHPEIARLWHAIDIYMKMITATVRSVREKQVGLIPPSVLRVIQLFCDFHMAMPRSAASQSAASLSYASLAGGETERFLVDSASAPSLVSNQASAAARQRAMDEVQRARGRRDTEWGLADDVVFADAGDAGFDQGGGRWMQQRGTSTGLSASPFVNLVHGGASSGTPASASASASAALGGGVGGPTSSGELNEEVRPRLPPMVRKFLDINRATINNLLHLRPELLHGALSYVLWEPSLIDFAFKRRDFLRRMASPRSNRISFAIRRSHCLEDTFVELNKMRNFDGPLHVRFVREEGVDMGGLTREWFGLLAKAFTDPLHALFTQCGTESYQPNPLSWANPHHLDYFHVVGLVLALAVRNGVAFDMHLTRAMYRHLLGNAPIFADLESVDRDIFVQYRRLLDADVNELGLNFVVDIHRFDVVTEEELVPNGRDVAVTNENKSQYVHKMANFRMTRSIEEQLLAFLKGFYTVIPRHHIQLFTELELELLICGTPDIDVDDLRANTHYDGYTSSSTQILWFWVAVAQMNKEDRANLLQFATGSSKVPAGGFSSLAQMRSDSRPYAFTINRWIPDDPEALPRAHTCFNTIDLPEYHSAEMLRDKLRLAITYGNVGFALT